MESYRSLMRTSIAQQISTATLTLLGATLAITLTLMTASLLLCHALLSCERKVEHC